MKVLQMLAESQENKKVSSSSTDSVVYTMRGSDRKVYIRVYHQKLNFSTIWLSVEKLLKNCWRVLKNCWKSVEECWKTTVEKVLKGVEKVLNPHHSSELQKMTFFTCHHWKTVEGYWKTVEKVLKGVEKLLKNCWRMLKKCWTV